MARTTLEEPTTPLLSSFHISFGRPIPKSPESFVFGPSPNEPLTPPSPPPRARRVHRKPVPQQEFSVSPLNIFTRRRNPTIERELVQCMACRGPATVSATAELVCSHFVHPACLKKLAADFSNDNHDSHPLCCVCRYPAKPKDVLINSHIRTVINAKSSGYITPPRSTPPSEELPVTPPRLRGPIRRPISIASSCYSELPRELEFEPYKARIPLRVNVTPVRHDLEISTRSSEAAHVEFLVTVSSQPQNQHCYSYTVHSRDRDYGDRICPAISRSLGITLANLGSLRLEKPFQYSSDQGKHWAPVTGYLFENYIVLVTNSPTSSTCEGFTSIPVLSVCIHKELKGLNLVYNNDAGVCARLILDNRSNPNVYLSAANREQIYQFVSALNDQNLHFPISKPKEMTLLLSPFHGGDCPYRAPCHTVLCLPSSISLSSAAEIIGRMQILDRLGIVLYDTRVTHIPLQRQSWEGWAKLFSASPRPKSYSNDKVSLTSVLSSAELLLSNAAADSGTEAVSSIVLVCDRPSFDYTIPSRLQALGITVNTIGVGSSHNPIHLTDIAANTSGIYSYVENSENVVSPLTAAAFAERNLTHKSVELVLKPRVGSISNVCGYRTGPGTHIQVSENELGHATVSLGNIHESSPRSVIVGVDIDASMLKYFISGNGIEVLEACVSGVVTNSSVSMGDRNICRISTLFSQSPRERTNQYFAALHSQIPVTFKSDHSTFFDLVSLSAAATLESVFTHIQGGTFSNAKSLLDKVLTKLQETQNLIGGFLAGIREDFEDPNSNDYLETSLLITALEFEVNFLLKELETQSALPLVTHAIWLLRSKRSFSRLSALDGLFFDNDEQNVI